MEKRQFLLCWISALSSLGAAGLVGCAASSGSEEDSLSSGVARADGKFDTSVEAVVLDFEFEGEFFINQSWGGYTRYVEDQLLYTIGHLNEQQSVGRLDRVQVTSLDAQPVAGGVKVHYSARMPVAWGRRESVPTTYDFKLPYDISYSGLEDFTAKYKDKCVDWSAHDVDSGSMWYYYRPGRCTLDAEDIYTSTASVSVSDVNTTGKYPEYHKIWEDNVFKTVAIFGKNEDGETSNSDVGISAYNSFLSAVEQRLAGSVSLRTEPASFTSNPGVQAPDVTFYAELADGKQVQVNVLLVDNVRTAGFEFDQRYAQLSPDADFIIYNGHAGLGSNIRALANKGRFKQGQYKVVFMNGCDTHAYVDSALSDATAAVNPDDPNGTKYLDVATNAMPAFFRSLRRDTMAFFEGFLDYDQPKTFEQIMASVDPSQIVLVTGEQDNVYVPGGGGGGGGSATDEPGLDEQVVLAQGETARFETPTLTPNTYLFSIEGSGDADLYVRVGQQPDARNYDCRPYRWGSDESCEIDLPTEAPIHVMLVGYEAANVRLTAHRIQRIQP